jgi:hypothetical protein
MAVAGVEAKDLVDDALADPVVACERDERVRLPTASVSYV